MSNKDNPARAIPQDTPHPKYSLGNTRAIYTQDSFQRGKATTVMPCSKKSMARFMTLTLCSITFAASTEKNILLMQLKKRNITNKKSIDFFSLPVIAFVLFKFLLSFVFTIFKIQKENNVVTGMGAEKIAPSKVIVFFAALLVGIIYIFCSNRVRQEWLFYGILIFFIVSFLLVGFLFRYRETLVPDTTQLMRYWNGYNYIKMWIVVYGNWLKILFFCLAEILGQLGIVVVFWGIANDFFSQKEAKKVYSLFIAAGCLGSIVGAFLLSPLCVLIEKDYDDVPGHTSEILGKISSLVCLIGAAVMGVILLGYHWMLRQPEVRKKISSKRIEKKKQPSFFQSCKYIFSDHYLRAITLLVVASGAAISLVGITYKKYVEHVVVKTPHAYVDWMILEFSAINIISIISCFSMTAYVMQKLSWKKVAYIAPTIVSCLGVTFFCMSIYNHYYQPVSFFGWTPKTFIAYYGRVQGILISVLKYVLFDTTKEMAFISLGKKSRRKGKGAVDIVGSRFGKGFASVVHCVVLMMFNTLNVLEVTPNLLIIFCICCFCWFYSIHFLADKVDKTPKKELPMPRKNKKIGMISAK